jgi:hypothetical protein
MLDGSGERAMTSQTSPVSQHADDSIHGGLGSQQIVQITDSGIRVVVGLLITFIVVVALFGIGLGYAIVQADAAMFQAKVAASESQAQTRAVIRLQASLVARGISLEEADPLINAPPKHRGTQ